jgi:hypothetical protein
MENSMETPQKTENTTTVRSSDSTIEYITKGGGNYTKKILVLPCLLHHCSQ